MKVFFIGAGPGDPELITCKGRQLVETADLIIYAGSLVNPEILNWKRPDVPVFDSAPMNLEQVCRLYKTHAAAEGIIARLHTGDPSLYGAIGEQIEFCREQGIAWEVVPGVSSFSAAAAALSAELTLPGISQTAILTRKSGRTKVPEKEELTELAKSGATLVLFLSASLVESAMRDIMTVYPSDTPAAAVYRASWPDQKVLRATVSSLAEKMRQEKMNRQTIIIVGQVLDPGIIEKSKLYDPAFTHGWRKGAGQKDVQDA